MAFLSFLPVFFDCLISLIYTGKGRAAVVGMGQGEKENTSLSFPWHLARI